MQILAGWTVNFALGILWLKKVGFLDELHSCYLKEGSFLLATGSIALWLIMTSQVWYFCGWPFLSDYFWEGPEFTFIPKSTAESLKMYIDNLLHIHFKVRKLSNTAKFESAASFFLVHLFIYIIFPIYQVCARLLINWISIFIEKG